MPGGAPIGNNNAGEGKMYRKALERALAHKHGSVADGLLAIAKARVDKAEDGDDNAAQEIANRFDGKPVQPVAGAEGEPAIEMVIRWSSEK